jgi:hypothetical protein
MSCKVVEKIKTHVLCSVISCCRNSGGLLDDVKKYCRATQIIEDKMVRSMHFKCCVTKARIHFISVFVNSSAKYLLLDKGAKGTYYCIYIATLYTFTL